MGKAPALAPCLFCGEMPCVCAKNARATPKPKKPPETNPGVTVDSMAVYTAPLASRRRFDATDAMRAASADCPLGVRIPAASERPTWIAAAPLSVRVDDAPDVLPAIAAARSSQAQKDSDEMDYAVHLVRTRLGGKPV